MDIVMNTTYSSSLLPRVPQPGFSDDFGRAIGPLGVTSGEGRAWEFDSNGVAPDWRVTSVGTASLFAGAAINTAVVDALTNNGTLTVTASSLGSNRRGGVVLRCQDAMNNLFLFQSAAGSGLTLFKRVAGTATSIATSSYIPANGDVYSVALFNSNITVKVNGATIITATDATFQGETRHGLYGTSDALLMGWDNISFTA
jgi:hypothetical protein